MRDEQLKVQLFRFVDVLPMLRDNRAVMEHLLEYLHEVRDRLPAPLAVALGLARRTPFTRAAVARAARLGAHDFARRFIAGTNRREVLEAAAREREAGRGFTLDILGEAVTSDREAEGYFEAYLELIAKITPVVNAWPENPQIDRGVTGPLPRMNLSVKLSALDSQFDALDFEGTAARVSERLRALFRAARKQGAFINIDMESYEKKDLTLHIFRTVLEEEEFRNFGDCGIVIQCYLRDAERDLRSLRDWAQRRGHSVWVRLVKGAYWDYETIHARANDWPIPVFQRKWESDASFERLSRFLLLNHVHLRPAFGTHNLRSIAHVIAAAEHLGMPENGFELQMLYGMADAEKRVLVERGHRLRIYMPHGELLPGMAYLVRRLLENTSNDSFLRAGFANEADTEELLRNPLEASLEAPSARNEETETPSRETGDTTMSATQTAKFPWTFHNEPPVDFAKAQRRRQMQEALAEVGQQFGRRYPLLLDGAPRNTERWITSFNPSHKLQVIGQCAAAEVEDAQRAVEAARRAAPEWGGRPVSERAKFLRRAAQAMRGRFFELAAWEVYECGKTWREAAGDVCEAIDFCEYYAHGAEEMWSERGVDVPGEENRFVYLPRGVTAVIAPWNFPLAILTGMTVAALVTGNPVIMKPAEQSSVIAAKLMEIFQELEIPPGVLQYLSGPGETVGAALVEHPEVAVIAFTGSRQVGLAINRRAAEVSVSAPQVKRVIAEMGGKNAILIDDDADLDEAVLGVARSAFGYQGQKCSACSRAIVHTAVYDAFTARLIEAVRSLRVGPAENPETTVGPVIDREAYERVQSYIDLGRIEGRALLASDTRELAEEGYYIGPHIFGDIAPDDRLAQEEVFGPVLAVFRVQSFEEGIQLANSTEYALTAGVFSRSPAHLDLAQRRLACGNLYLNRGTTGALVGRQPFGGYRMSGIGSKAGGPDYLLQFVVPRTITENTLRRGFAPPEE